MRYDPDRHHRRSIRLRRWDHTRVGAYFVTICVQNRQCVFGDVVDGEMRPNAWGNIVAEYWQGLPRHFPNIALGPFAAMPNHVHFILWLNPVAQSAGAQPVGAQLNCAPTGDKTVPTSPIGKRFTVDKQHPTLGQVVRAFKAATARLIRQAGAEGFAWQRGYYEHIIRNEDELRRIGQYILANPANWTTDDENPTKQA